MYSPYFKQVIKKKDKCSNLLIKILFNSKPEIEKIKKISTKNNLKVKNNTDTDSDDLDDEDDDNSEDENNDDYDSNDFEENPMDSNDNKDKFENKDCKDIHEVIGFNNQKSNFNRRKNFSNSQVINALKNQRNRCAVLDIEFDDFLNPYDKDHKDNDSSNNDDSNLQLLSMIAHRHKTLENQTKNNLNNKKMIDNKGLFIANTINSLSRSSHFKKLLKNGKISFKANEYDDEGILNISL